MMTQCYRNHVHFVAGFRAGGRRPTYMNATVSEGGIGGTFSDGGVVLGVLLPIGMWVSGGNVG